MTGGYAYDHGWEVERLRLAGLEAALDPGTRAHLTRLGVKSGARCLEVGAGGGSVALWLAQQVAPTGVTVAVDLETDFLEAEAQQYSTLEVRRLDIMEDELPTGFDVIHARWLIEWLPDKRRALRRLAEALRPGGVLLIEEPDFVTMFGAAEPAALRHVALAAARHLESTCPVEVEYGRRAVEDLIAAGLIDVEAEGRCPIVPGGHPLAAHFLRYTFEKFREPLLAAGSITEDEFTEAVRALQNPETTVVAPMTVAAWGWWARRSA
jgi:SAM-dependent methyltransferase